MKILNLTQHCATAEQLAAGVINLKGSELEKLKLLLTFGDVPTKNEIEARAYDISQLADFNGLGGDGEDPFFTHVMIGGAPYLMSALEVALKSVCKTPLYAFSKRVSCERVNDQGDIEKTVIFRFEGFIEV